MTPQPGERYRPKNTMFWRADQRLKTLQRDQRWVDFHRACGRCGLFFDDIDPVNDKPTQDVTDKMRAGGYRAVSFRASQDRAGNYMQVFVSRGTGKDPVDAVLSTYRAAVESGDPVARGLESMFDGPPRALGEPEREPAPTAAVDIMELIG